LNDTVKFFGIRDIVSSLQIEKCFSRLAFSSGHMRSHMRLLLVL
jgi:hypothetical protein